MIPRRVFWLFDLAVFCLAFSVAYRISPGLARLGAPGGALAWALGWMRPWARELPPPQEHLWMLLVLAPAGVLGLGLLGAHRGLGEQSLTRVVLSSLLAPLLGLGLITSIIVALKSPDWSRVFIFSLVGLSCLGLLAYRLALRAYFLQRLRAGAYARNVLLIGTDGGVETLAGRLAGAVQRGDLRLAGYLRAGAPPAVEERAGLTCLGDARHLDTLLIRRPIHEVVAAQPSGESAWLAGVVRACDQVGVPLRVVPEVLLTGPFETLTALRPPAPTGLGLGVGLGAPDLPGVVLAPLRQDADALFVKRALDVAVSALLLVALAPLLALVALAVKLSSPGPVLYRWHVVGEKGREFTGYKFRTMVANADALKAALLAQNEMRGPVFKMADDPRITPVGRVLRKYSLDELPQLWSVLKGDMSLVGPRPAFRSELERYEFWQMRKLSTRPGITCLWQVRGRNAITDFDEWVRLDLEYIDTWSLWLDCKILARTAWAVVAGTGR
jgi:lipopolysaccharide/colanic/teichoic acid biosynthesis glycosyltransferase